MHRLNDFLEVFIVFDYKFLFRKIVFMEVRAMISGRLATLVFNMQFSEMLFLLKKMLNLLNSKMLLIQ